jgi:hypothetical protein
MRRSSILLLCLALPLMGCPDEKEVFLPATEDGVSAADSSGEVEAVVDTVIGVDLAEVEDEVAGGPDVPVEPIQCLGTVYPDSGPFDPDNPIYEDEYYTQEQVTKMFAQAKEDNTKAYRAYLAAYLYPELLECAFCYCGCSEPPTNHISALDCFKDIHGFG